MRYTWRRGGGSRRPLQQAEPPLTLAFTHQLVHVRRRAGHHLRNPVQDAHHLPGLGLEGLYGLLGFMGMLA